MTTRRGFLGAVAGAIAGVLALPKLLEAKPERYEDWNLGLTDVMLETENGWKVIRECRQMAESYGCMFLIQDRTPPETLWCSITHHSTPDMTSHFIVRGPLTHPRFRRQMRYQTAMAVQTATKSWGLNSFQLWRGWRVSSAGMWRES